MKDYLTMKEAGEYLGVCKAKMWRLVKAGTLPAYQDSLDKRKKLVKREDIEKLKQPKPL